MSLWLTISRRLALAFGVLIPLGETIRRWGVWGYPPAWLDDFCIGAFLLLAAWRARPGREPSRARAWLAGAWGFTAGIGYTSFFTHLEHLHEPDPGNVPQIWLTAIIGGGWLIVLAALAMTLCAPATRACDQGVAAP